MLLAAAQEARAKLRRESAKFGAAPAARAAAPRGAGPERFEGPIWPAAKPRNLFTRVAASIGRLVTVMRLALYLPAGVGPRRL